LARLVRRVVVEVVVVLVTPTTISSGLLTH
jgi:hypothetical protein